MAKAKTISDINAKYSYKDENPTLPRSCPDWQLLYNHSVRGELV